jgi:hypothetical protein
VSSPLAIAAVTAILKDLLNEGLINNDLSPVGSFSVTALPPDRITIGETEESRLNLFLYQITPNIGWRNAGMPSRDAAGVPLTNPPLALDLHYMLTAYGATDLTAEILLGYAMDLLHDTPVLTREVVKRALSPNDPVSVNLIPPDSQGRTAIDLADQIEVLKVTPSYLSADELSKLWTAMQARYRPTMAYQVSTVLIQGARPTRSPLPVLRRGSEDRGVSTIPTLARPLPEWPTLLNIEIEPADGNGPRATAEMGDALIITGALLSGETVTAEFRHRLLANPIELPVLPTGTANVVKVTLPGAADADAPNWPAGYYGVSLRIEQSGKPDRWTKDLFVALAPRLKPAPELVDVGGQSELKTTVAPRLWPGQRVDLFVGNDGHFKVEVGAKTDTIQLPVDLVPSEVPLAVRLRVDGVENNLIRKPSERPLQFDSEQSILVPA